MPCGRGDGSMMPEAAAGVEAIMIVIYRNGVPTVISGWRAWLMLFVIALVTVFVVCLLLGIALTLATLFLFALPVLFVLALVVHLVHLVQSRR